MATEVFVEDHVPPVVALDKVVLAPKHSDVEPVIEERLLIDITLDATHPDTVYEIVEVPPAIPVNKPVDDPIVATVGLALVHIPPLVASVRVVDVAGHKLELPDIVETKFTSTVVTA